MIIQCSNGKFYRGAIWMLSGKFPASVIANECDLVFSRYGKASWRTCVKALTALGIRARCKKAEYGTAIMPFDNTYKLVECSVFTIELISKPPPPLQSTLILESEPVTDDEPIIKFGRKKKCSGRVSSRGKQ